MKRLFLSALAAWTLAGAAAVAQPGPRAGGWDLPRREAWLQQRIDRGVQDGSLTRGERRRVQGELDRIRREEHRLRRMHGGRLAPPEQRRLEARLDDLSNHVRWARRNEVARPWR